jgi:hypothetical protein
MQHRWRDDSPRRENRHNPTSLFIESTAIGESLKRQAELANDQVRQMGGF